MDRRTQGRLDLYYNIVWIVASMDTILNDF